MCISSFYPLYYFNWKLLVENIGKWNQILYCLMQRLSCGIWPLYISTSSSFTNQIVYIFKNKDMILHSRSVTTNIRKLTSIYYYYLIFEPLNRVSTLVLITFFIAKWPSLEWRLNRVGISFYGLKQCWAVSPFFFDLHEYLSVAFVLFCFCFLW